MRNGAELYKRIATRQTAEQRWNDLPDEERARTSFSEWRKIIKLGV